VGRYCGWLGRDDDGRPYCVHGPAWHQGSHWRCRFSHKQANRAYMLTDKGRDYSRRRNASPAQQSSKQLYELSRIRTGG
jgi:hypothetical protein